MDEKYDVQPQYMLLSLIALVMRIQPLTPDKVACLSALLTMSWLVHKHEDNCNMRAGP